MPRTRDKVAVSIPRQLLVAVELIRKRSGVSRSAVFERALAAYVASADAAAKARAYVDAYRRRPEKAGVERAAIATALEALATQRWDA